MLGLMEMEMEAAGKEVTVGATLREEEEEEKTENDRSNSTAARRCDHNP